MSFHYILLGHEINYKIHDTSGILLINFMGLPATKSSFANSICDPDTVSVKFTKKHQSKWIHIFVWKIINKKTYTIFKQIVVAESIPNTYLRIQQNETLNVGSLRDDWVRCKIIYEEFNGTFIIISCEDFKSKNFKDKT